MASFLFLVFFFVRHVLVAKRRDSSVGTFLASDCFLAFVVLLTSTRCWLGNRQFN